MGKSLNFEHESRTYGEGKHARQRDQNRGAFHALPAPKIYTTEYRGGKLEIPASVQLLYHLSQTQWKKDGARQNVASSYPFLLLPQR